MIPAMPSLSGQTTQVAGPVNAGATATGAATSGGTLSMMIVLALLFVAITLIFFKHHE